MAAATPPFVRSIDTDLGRLLLCCTARGMSEIRWLRPGERPPGGDGGHPLLDRAERAVRAYLRTGRPVDLPVDAPGLTAFQRRVLETLRELVGPGQTVSYGELAALAGKPGAARAVGGVMARNPLPIIYPCHRVVGASGPGGFGPGLGHKRRLLALEGGTLPA